MCSVCDAINNAVALKEELEAMLILRQVQVMNLKLEEGRETFSKCEALFYEHAASIEKVASELQILKSRGEYYRGACVKR